MSSMKKRILIFSTAYFPLIGGAEVAVKEITGRINDFEFVMVSPRLRKDLPETEQMDNLTIHRIGRGNNFDKFRLFLQGPKYAKSLGEFGAIWSIMASYAGFTALRYKKENKQVPFLLTLQEGDTKAHIYSRAWFVWPYFKQIFKKADRIQAISKYLADWAREMGAKAPIDIVPNGVDVERFQDTCLPAGMARNKIQTDEKDIITVSRLVDKNGVEDLIKAMAFLSENVHLIILGDGELKGHLEEVSKNNNLNKRIHFAGNVAPKEVYNYLAKADVFCRPSLSEGLGNAFLEAMSVGLPVVATKVGGIPDFLVDGETGWFCEVKDPRSIAEKIKYILDEKNKEEVLRVMENAKKMVKEKYGWELVAQKMERIFNLLVFGGKSEK